jgi:circadian clock protein KaiB
MSEPVARKAILVLRLYVAGDAPNSLSAIANAKAICDTHFKAQYKIEIVDMLLQPLRALADGVVVSPTLLRVAPPPVRRMIGNLSNTSQVLQILAAE